MSFLRRDKSRANLKPSFGFGEAKLNSLNLADRQSANDSKSESLNPADSQKLNTKPSSHSAFPSPTSRATKSSGFPFNSEYSDSILFDDHNHTRNNKLIADSMAPSLSHDHDEDYSPRSSIVSLSKMGSNSEAEEAHDHVNLKDNYKGFHANRRGVGVNVPPLSHPIKPRFKKKSGSLLGKLIYSSSSARKDSESSAHSADSNAHSHHTATHNSVSEPSSSRNNSVGSGSNSQNQPTRKSVSSSGSSGSSKHKFRIPSMSSHSSSSHPNTLELPDRPPPQKAHDFHFPGGKIFDLDINPNELNDIIKPISQESTDSSGNQSPSDLALGPLPSIDRITQSATTNDEIANALHKYNNDTRSESSSLTPNPLLRKSFTSTGVFKSQANLNKLADPKGSWKAPDSWDVKIDKSTSGDANPDGGSLSDSDESEEKIDSNKNGEDAEITKTSGNHLTIHENISNDQCSISSLSTNGLLTSDDGHHNKTFSPDGHKKLKHKPSADEDAPIQSHLPVLYGSRQRYHVVDQKDQTGKGPNHIIRVFKEDNTFTTILCPLETTTAELLRIVQRKFFMESTSNCQIAVYIGNCVKVLESFEKPLKIQMGLLILSGYQDNDSLQIIGREDLSFICKFVVEDILLRSLTHEEETMLSKDYVDVDISGLNLKNIPIIFHQHTYEIERLIVSDNPSIYIPLDFIQSCNNLTTIVFAANGCSKFPTNFLEAKKLTHLDLEKNFLDELPPKFGHLKNLTHLKLNSNQLSSLPKSFGKLKNLMVLNLSSNYFNSYPEAINDLVNLKDLDLSYNDLSLIPDSIGNLVNLSKLNLSTNKLSKILPDCFTKLVSLKRLDIRYNTISNVDVLGSLPNLEVAYASKNNISAFSDEMESLRLLHFDRNPITNLEFRNLLPLLTVLDLSKAKITSIPPEFIGRIPHIEKLVLNKNHLVTLPDELGSLSKLAFLSLYGNNLQVLPSTIGKLTSLQFLDLHSNNLQSLPDDIWNLKSLSVLNVSSNILTSFPKPPLPVVKRISSSVNFKQSLTSENGEEIDIDRPVIHPVDENDRSNNLLSIDSVPTITDTPGSEKNDPFSTTSSSLADGLLVLTIADNRLTDVSFESISLLSELKSLNLSYNDLLEIPEGALRRLTRLTELYLSGNELTTLPADDLEHLKSLKLIFVNNNKLVTLPAELSKLVYLQHLDVGSNQLKYNISNWPYDWNWHWNKNLRYLNFSGNKRFEIKQSHIKNPETNEDFDSLLVLKHLKVLGLIDVTLTSTSVPDQNVDMRIRTTASEMDNIGYGVSDSMGTRERISSRDIFLQKFRGNENEVLICSFDGKNGAPNVSHRISHLAKSLLVPIFTNELNKLKSDEGIEDAIRRTFLSLNKEINGVLYAMKNNNFTSVPAKSELAELNLNLDSDAGCAVTIIYLKDKTLYSANIGDVSALISRNNEDYIHLTTKHDPTNRPEFERIRASGGYVSGDGALDGILPVSRGVGFFNFLPHTNSGPSIKRFNLTDADDMIMIATKVFWDYVSCELAVDILRQEKNDPMVAAQKLRDYAICYGATDKIAVIVVTLGQQKSSKSKFGSNALYNNLSRENEVFTNKKRRDRTLQAGDLALRRLDDEIEPPVGELALVFTDIKNSTLLWDAYPVAMRSAIKLHNTIMRRQLRIVGGYEVKTEGDAFMVSFPSPTSALLWCFNVQHQLLTEDWPAEILETDQCCEVTDGKGNIIFRGLSVRMGVHWGSPVCELDMVTRRMDYFGPMVNRASRISAVADGGQIAMSSDFLAEIKTLYKIHEDIREEKVSLNDAYHGNVRAGEIIEKEITSIEENGLAYYELGEKKLKGLETPELVTLVIPKKLEIRFEIFQKNSEDKPSPSTQIVGTLPVDCIYGLRTISLRLEGICSMMNGGFYMNEGFQQNSSGIISTKLNTDFKESDLISLFNHVVTRIEHCVVTLELRQKLSQVSGTHGKINFVDTKHIIDVMDDFYKLVFDNSPLAAMLNDTAMPTSNKIEHIESTEVSKD